MKKNETSNPARIAPADVLELLGVDGGHECYTLSFGDSFCASLTVEPKKP